MQVKSPCLAALRVLLVGAGWAGRRQLEAAKELDEEIEFVGLVEPDGSQARSTANEFDVAQVYDSLEEALRSSDAEAVSICTPHRFHSVQTIAALRAGRHVLCEKPMAMTVSEATGMLAAAGQADRVLFVNEQDAYEPVVDQLRAFVGDGTIGAFVSASLEWGFAARDFSYAGRRAWLTDPSVGGTGTWMLHGVHKVAQARAVLGEICSVAAVSHLTDRSQRRNIEGSMRVLCELARGGAVDLLVTSESPIPDRWRWTLFGTDAVVNATPTSVTISTTDGTTAVPVAEASRSSYAQTLAAFAASVRTGEPGRTSGASECRTLVVVEAAVESSRLCGQPRRLATGQLVIELDSSRQV